MRYVISAAAFLVPMLIAVAIGTTAMGEAPAKQARLGSAELGELRDFVQSREALLERYSLTPGPADSTTIPHLALERFDRRGCAPGGRPWFRLAVQREDVSCGIVRRGPAGSQVPVADGSTPTLQIPLSPQWSYWEVAKAPAKSP